MQGDTPCYRKQLFPRRVLMQDSLGHARNHRPCRRHAGGTRTDFLAAALEKAEQVIAEQSLVRLVLEDQRVLAAALLLEETEAPSSFLVKLSSEYAQRMDRR